MQLVDLQHFQISSNPPVGAGLLANTVDQSPSTLNDTPHSRASPLPHWKGVCSFSGRGRPRSRARFPALVPVSLRPKRCPGATR
ncbi:hypothetical protein C2E19_04155 [Pseudomonas sp. DTU12.3]|nr:hypothetical protein C2E19_04155 [Pseudomonas sp. DTU12.3]